jgi:hypothetical protein
LIRISNAIQLVSSSGETDMATRTSMFENEIDKKRKEDMALARERVGGPVSEAYDKWFQAKVREAMEYPSLTIPHHAVMDEVQAIIDRKYARV